MHQEDDATDFTSSAERPSTQIATKKARQGIKHCTTDVVRVGAGQQPWRADNFLPELHVQTVPQCDSPALNHTGAKSRLCFPSSPKPTLLFSSGKIKHTLHWTVAPPQPLHRFIKTPFENGNRKCIANHASQTIAKCSADKSVAPQHRATMRT